MSERQNFTIAVPRDLLRKAKVLAAKRGTSISSLVTHVLADLVRQEDEYEAATRRILAGARRGLDLGTHGRIDWTRDEIHERGG